VSGHSFYSVDEASGGLVPAISTDRSTLLSPKSGSNLERVEVVIKRTLGRRGFSSVMDYYWIDLDVKGSPVSRGQDSVSNRGKTRKGISKLPTIPGEESS
jgi:hypothetical protein